MSLFHLKILTPERTFFEGEVELLSVMTTEGARGFLAHHESFIGALSIGHLRIKYEGKVMEAAIGGGVVKTNNERNEALVLANCCEWAKDIDVARARKAEEKARELLRQHKSQGELEVARFRLNRAINRIRMGSK